MVRSVTNMTGSLIVAGNDEHVRFTIRVGLVKGCFSSLPDTAANKMPTA